MWRLLIFLIVVTVIAYGMAVLADQPGDVSVSWLGTTIETSIYFALFGVGLLLIGLLLVWALVRYIIGRPRAVREYLVERNDERGREALARGMIAAEIGDGDIARRSAIAAHKALPEDPLTSLLRAKAARLTGDRETARVVLEDMTKSPETKLAGLHGLYLEAVRENESVAARQFAEQSMAANPRLEWSSDALFGMQARAGEWQAATETLEKAERAGQAGHDEAKRKRAVLLTAQALELENSDMDRARELALEAHKLAPELVPAAALAARLLAAQGSTYRAGRVIFRTWALSPHPELATAYAYLRVGDSPRERLNRVRELADSAQGDSEGAVAIANAAIDARDWDAGRQALAPLLDDRPTARVFTLMARIEENSSSDAGRVREWLGRALRAPRDPAWMADGVVFNAWAAVSPLSGEVDAFRWMAPVEALSSADTPIIEHGGGAIPDMDAAQTSEPTPNSEGMPTEQPLDEGERTGQPAEAADAAAQSGEPSVPSADEEPAKDTPAVDAVKPSGSALPRSPDDPGEKGSYVDDEAASEQPVPGPPPEQSK
jgi:HemY protein